MSIDKSWIIYSAYLSPDIEAENGIEYLYASPHKHRDVCALVSPCGN